MARENRKENRAAAKAASENNDNGDVEKGGNEPGLFDDILDLNEGNNDEDDSSGFGGNADEDNNNNDNDDDGGNASKSEDGKTSDTKEVDKGKTEEDRLEEEASAKKAEEDAAKAKADEDAAAKKAEDEAKAKEVEPAKKEPTAEEIAEAEKAKAAETKTLSDEEAATLFKDWRGETEKILAEHHYALSEEDVAQFNDDPAKFVSRAMSRVYIDSISAAFQQFVIYLPRMVNQVIEQNKIIEEKDNAFFSAWPELKAHKEKVLRLGAAYRSVNPGASEEDFVQEVGAQAMVALRLTPKGQTVEDTKPKTVEKPFKPAAAGGDTREPPVKKETNPFAKLLDEFSADSLDVEEISGN